MIFSVCYFLLIFLTVIGLISLFEVLSDKIYSPSCDHLSENTIFLKFSGHKEDMEYIVRKIIYNRKNENSNYEIIFLCSELDSETKKICELFSKDFEFIKLK